MWVKAITSLTRNPFRPEEASHASTPARTVPSPSADGMPADGAEVRPAELDPDAGMTATTESTPAAAAARIEGMIRMTAMVAAPGLPGVRTDTDHRFG